jgi:peptidoglycan/LPS O-acetylase OafA/YrhL
LTARANIPALTGLRFFAAFFILFAHACDWNAQFTDSKISSYAGALSMYGMPLFFVLSGFVIHYNYKQLFAEKLLSTAIGNFAAARFARLFPLYFCLLLVDLFADNFNEFAYNRPYVVWEAALFFLTLTQSWFYLLWEGRMMISWLFPLSWSVSTEAFFYVAYVGIAFALMKITKPRDALVATLIYAFVVMTALVITGYHQERLTALVNFTGAADFANSFYRWLFFYSPYVRIFEFIMGCLTAHLFVALQNRPVTKSEQRCGTAALFGALAFMITVPLIQTVLSGTATILLNHLSLNFLFAPALAVVMFCTARYDTAFARFMSLPLLVVLGETSYSIYLVHSFTLRPFSHSIPALTWFWGLETLGRIIISLAFTLVVAYGTYRTIEVPGRMWLRRLFAKDPLALTAVPSHRSKTIDQKWPI